MLFSFLFITLQAFSQKKEQIEDLTSTIDSLSAVNTGLMTQLDSLTKLNATLTSVLDSTSKGLAFYYTTIKEKVLTRDFDPAALPDIIDSLRNSRDEKITGLETSSETLADSVTVLKSEVTLLKDSVSTLENADADRDKLVEELKQIKELLDSGIFTQEEYDSKKAAIMEKW